MKSVIILILNSILFFISASMLAQEEKYLPNTRGEVIPASDVEKYVKPQHKDNLKRNIFGDIIFNPDLVEDTISYRHLFPNYPNLNFGFFGQDRMLQWFNLECMEIVAVGLMCQENDLNAQASVKLVKFNWDKELLDTISFPQRLGYYEADGNGYNNITAFLDDPDRTGPWIDVTGNNLEGPFVEDLWSNNGSGYVFTPVPDPGLTNYNWIQLNEPVEVGICVPELIGIAVKNLFPIMDSTRIGWYAANNDDTGIPPAFKFYVNGRNEPGVDYGWWAREFTWDFALVVNIINDCHPIIFIDDFTMLGTTISNEPRWVEAYIPIQNPYCNTYIKEVLLEFSTDGGINWTDSVMTATGEPDHYSAYTPGFPPGTEVTYKIKATDNYGNLGLSFPVVYNIFEVQNPGTTLIVFNGYNWEAGAPYPKNYYFGADIQTGTTTFPHDVWSYDGPVESALLDNYTNVFEIWNADHGDYNDTSIRAWLEGAGNRNYFLAGQEYLGAKSGYVDSAYVAGDFEYDILGIMQSYNDITYYYGDPVNETNTIGDSLGTVQTPLAGTLFGDPLLIIYNSLTPQPDSMLHNPLTILDPGDGSELNWQDGFDVVSGVNVDMNVETRGVGNLRGPGPEVQILPTLAHRELTAGNKIVFCAFDPLSLNTEDDSTAADFHWIGFNNASPTYQALLWFGIPVGVELEEKELTPEEFRLFQNYPNPFNPSTKIRVTIPGAGTRRAVSVQLKVYDVLGNEIAALLNEEKPVGNYEVEWNAEKFPSGVYFYQLKAGSFIETKKMVILR